MTAAEQKNTGRFKLLIVAMTLLLCLCIFYFFFLRSVKKQQGYSYFSVEKTIAGYPFSNQQQVLNLGWVHKIHDGLSSTSYLHYDTLKKPGVFRIGIFGCSFTEAFDVSPRHDFASLLQQKYRREGYDSVEVISFGTGGYSLGQMCMLYEYAGKKYDLDVVVVNSFFMYHFTRDLSFRLYNNYGPLHARYITTADSIQLIEYKDTTLAAAYSNYYSLVPDKNYLRYDYKPTGFLLPLGLQFNPFYYRNPTRSLSSLIEETQELYEGLLKKIGSNAKKLVVICNDEHSFALKDKFQPQGNVVFYQSHYYQTRSRSTSLYTSTSWHNSPLGNQCYADELYSVLNEQNLPTTYLKFESNFNHVFNSNEPFDSLAFEIGGSIIHQLYTAAPTEISDEDWNREPDFASAVQLSSPNISNLLLLNQAFSDLSFINIKESVSNNDTVFFSASNHQSTERFPIGLVKAVAPRMYQVQLFRNSFMQHGFWLQFKEGYQNLLSDFRLLFYADKETPQVHISVSKNEFAIPVKKSAARLVASADAYHLTVDHVSYFLTENFPDKTLLSCPVYSPDLNDAVMRCRMNNAEYLPADSMTNGSAGFNLVLYKNNIRRTFPFLKIVNDTL